MVFYNHELKVNRKLLFIWSVIVAGMILVMMLIFPSMKEEMSSMMEGYSNMGAFSDAFGLDKLQMGTAMGFFGIEAGSMLAIGGGMFAAIIGTSLLSKEEGGHTTEFIYICPKSREYFVTSKLLAMATIIALFDLVCFGASVAGFAFIGESIVWKKFLVYFVAQLLMHLQIGCMCFGLSAFLRKANIGLGIGIALLLYFVNMIANITGSVENLRYLSPYYYSDAAIIFDKVSIPMEHLLVGIGFAVIGIVLGYVKYVKKDLNI